MCAGRPASRSLALLSTPSSHHHASRLKFKQLVECFSRTIIAFEGVASSQAPTTNVEEIHPALRASWCGLYCGGSFKIQAQLHSAAKKWGVGWQAELFDW